MGNYWPCVNGKEEDVQQRHDSQRHLLGSSSTSRASTNESSECLRGDAVNINYILTNARENKTSREKLKICSLGLNDIIHNDHNDEIEVQRFAFGERKSEVDEKIILLVGGTGSGKTTLINAMVNHIIGVKWEDPIRFKLVAEEPTQEIQAARQTTKVTSYTIYHQAEFSIPFSVTVIDTPGLMETGTDETLEIVNKFFRPPGLGGISHIDVIGYVVQASLPRLTATQQLTLSKITSICSEDIQQKLHFLTTFADGRKPQVLSALKEAGFDDRNYYKFNNSALYVDGHAATVPNGHESSDESFDEMFWDIGIKGFTKFFRHIHMPQTDSDPRKQTVTSDKTTIERETRENDVIRLDEVQSMMNGKCNSGLKEEFSVYKLQLHSTSTAGSDIIDYELGEKVADVAHKTILLVGALGSGKTSLINTIVNYVIGVEWEHQFRFKVIPESINPNQAESQTSKVTSYTIHYQDWFTIPFTLRLIDTPSFQEIGKSKATEQLQKLLRLSDNSDSDCIDVIGIVVEASLSTLTPAHRHMVSQITSLCTPTQQKKISLFVTFAESNEHLAPRTIKEAGVSYQNVFTFNNSTVYANSMPLLQKEDYHEQQSDKDINKDLWQNGMKNFKDLINYLSDKKQSSEEISRTPKIEDLLQIKTDQNQQQSVEDDIISNSSNKEREDNQIHSSSADKSYEKEGLKEVVEIDRILSQEENGRKYVIGKNTDTLSVSSEDQEKEDFKDNLNMQKQEQFTKRQSVSSDEQEMEESKNKLNTQQQEQDSNRQSASSEDQEKEDFKDNLNTYQLENNTNTLSVSSKDQEKEDSKDILNSPLQEDDTDKQSVSSEAQEKEDPKDNLNTQGQTHDTDEQCVSSEDQEKEDPKDNLNTQGQEHDTDKQSVSSEDQEKEDPKDIFNTLGQERNSDKQSVSSDDQDKEASKDEGKESNSLYVSTDEIIPAENNEENGHVTPTVSKSLVHSLEMQSIMSGEHELIQTTIHYICHLEKDLEFPESGEINAQSFTFGTKSPNVPEKAILFAGASDIDKTMLINTMVNYIFNVKWEKPFRFKLIQGSSNHSKAGDQSPMVSCYTICHQEGFNFPFTLTIIDIPEVVWNRKGSPAEELGKILSLPQIGGIEKIDGIGFVAKADISWLTPNQKSAFTQIEKVFGNLDKVFLLLTDDSSEQPMVLSAIKKEGIRCQKNVFRFNNWIMFDDKRCLANVHDVDECRYDEEIQKKMSTWQTEMENMEKFLNQIASDERELSDFYDINPVKERKSRSALSL